MPCCQTWCSRQSLNLKGRCVLCSRVFQHQVPACSRNVAMQLCVRLWMWHSCCKQICSTLTLSVLLNPLPLGLLSTDFAVVCQVQAFALHQVLQYRNTEMSLFGVRIVIAAANASIWMKKPQVLSRSCARRCCRSATQRTHLAI